LKFFKLTFYNLWRFEWHDYDDLGIKEIWNKINFVYNIWLEFSSHSSWFTIKKEKVNKINKTEYKYTYIFINIDQQHQVVGHNSVYFY
jgi:hypothetical protein